MTPPTHTPAGTVSHSHRTPRDCPVCGERLVIHALGCEHCGTELSGSFQPCAYCGLPADDLETLRVFLVSRGNMRELEKHLGVSYPTARQRFAELLARLGFEGDSRPVDPERVLTDLAAGRIGVEEAETLLAGLRATTTEG
jgi:hypothetical protein